MTIVASPAPRTLPPAHGLLGVAAPVLAREQPGLPLGDDPHQPLAGSGVPSRAARAAQVITVAVVEALVGRRPASQLDAVADGPVHAMLTQLARSGLAVNLRLRSLRVQAPCDHGLEVAFHLGDATRSRAGALRLEQGRRGWRCVELQIALTPSAVTSAGSGPPRPLPASA